MLYLVEAGVEVVDLEGVGISHHEAVLRAARQVEPVRRELHQVFRLLESFGEVHFTNFQNRAHRNRFSRVFFARKGSTLTILSYHRAMDTHQEDTDTDIITNQEALQENFNGTGKATSEEIPDQRTSGIGSTITVECSSQMEDTVRERSTDQPDVPISTENEPVVQLSNQPGTPDCAVQCSASDREPDAQGNVSPSSQLAELPQVQGEVEEGDGGLMEVAMVAGVGSKGASMSCMASPEQPEAAMTEQTEEKREEREREESSAAR